MEPGSQYYRTTVGQPDWEVPPEASAAAAPAQPRARVWAILLTTVLVELLLIGGAANQWVSDRIVRNAADAGLGERLVRYSWLTYTWRVGPRNGQTATWGAQLLLIATVVVVSTLLAWVLLRGAVTFGRAFFGTWTAVVFASLLGGFVRGLVNPDSKATLPGAGRLTRAVYSSFGPSQTVVAGAFAFGLVVALVVALIAVATRRRPKPAAPAQPAAPPAFADYAPPPPSAAATMRPWQDQHYGPPAGAPVFAPGQPAFGESDRTTVLPRPAEEPDAPTAALPHGQDDEAATSALPRRPDEPGDQPTTALPRVESETGAGTTAPHPEDQPGDQPTTQLPAAGEQPPADHPAAGDQPTARFPRPPDDEDLGHIDH